MKGNGCFKDGCADFNTHHWICDSEDSMVDRRSIRLPDPVPICKHNTDFAISTVEWKARRKDYLEQKKQEKAGPKQASVADWVKSLKGYTA